MSVLGRVGAVLAILGASLLGREIFVAVTEPRIHFHRRAPIDVACADRDLEAGHVVVRGDIALAQIPHCVLEALQKTHLPAEYRDGLEGLVLQEPVKEGQILQCYHFCPR